MSILGILEREWRQSRNQVKGLDADIHDPAYQFEDVTRLLDLLAPLVWIVADLRVLVDGHCVALHDPLNWRLAVDLPIIGTKRDVDNSGCVVEVDDAFVLLSIALAEPHLQNLRRGRIIVRNGIATNEIILPVVEERESVPVVFLVEAIANPVTRDA